MYLCCDIGYIASLSWGEPSQAHSYGIASASRDSSERLPGGSEPAASDGIVRIFDRFFGERGARKPGEPVSGYVEWTWPSLELLV
jgi:hypothetical protein